MKAENIFSIKDFFNYYFPGVIWILVFVVLLIPIHPHPMFYHYYSDLGSYVSEVPESIWLILLVIIPYIIGFAMNPMVVKLTKKLQKGNRNAIVYSMADEKIGNKVQLWRNKRRLIEKYSRNLFHGDGKNPKEYFFYIRSYVADHGGEMFGLIVRVRNILEFSEAMLIPFPLLMFFIGIRLIYPFFSVGFMLIGISFLSFYFLYWRYFRLREIWVKHIYRAFLVIMRNEELTKKKK